MKIRQVVNNSWLGSRWDIFDQQPDTCKIAGLLHHLLFRVSQEGLPPSAETSELTNSSSQLRSRISNPLLQPDERDRDIKAQATSGVRVKCGPAVNQKQQFLILSSPSQELAAEILPFLIMFWKLKQNFMGAFDTIFMILTELAPRIHPCIVFGVLRLYLWAVCATSN